MFSGIMGGPLWITYHLPDYRNGANPHKHYIRMQKKKEAAEQ